MTSPSMSSSTVQASHPMSAEETLEKVWARAGRAEDFAPGFLIARLMTSGRSLEARRAKRVEGCDCAECAAWDRPVLAECLPGYRLRVLRAQHTTLKPNRPFR